MKDLRDLRDLTVPESMSADGGKSRLWKAGERSVTCRMAVTEKRTWFRVDGLWFMVYGLWFMIYGLWFMVYGLWFIIYD